MMSIQIKALWDDIGERKNFTQVNPLSLVL